VSTATVTDLGTYEFREALTKNGAPWDLTGAAVTWIARKPDGSYLSGAATIADAAGGVAKYVCPAADLDQDGRWSYRWRVQQSGVDVTTLEADLLVVP
jgi:hypothetical protein